MSNSVKILGHAVHPILIAFPLGLLATATVFDVLFLVLKTPTLAIAAYWMLIAGVIGGLAAALFGWLDWFGIPADTRAKRIGLIHGVVNAIGLVVFAASIWLRYSDEAHPPTVAAAASVIGALLALVGGWFGGELVERLGMAVHRGAHADAPSSLSVSEAELSSGRDAR